MWMKVPEFGNDFISSILLRDQAAGIGYGYLVSIDLRRKAVYVNSQRTNLIVDTNWLHLEVLINYEHKTFDLDLAGTTTTFLSEQPLL